MSRWFRDLDAERRIAAAEGQAADLRGVVQQLLQQNHDLVSQIAAMKRDNFDAPPAPVVLSKPEPRFPPKVQDAISQRAEPRSREWGILERTASDLLAKGGGEEEVAMAILVGEDPDELL